MKSDIMENRYFLECSCYSHDHMLIFDLDVFGDRKDPSDYYYAFISVYPSSSYKAPLLTRIKWAWRYIRYKNPIVWADSVIFDDRNIEQLENMVGVIKDFKKQHEGNFDWDNRLFLLDKLPRKKWNINFLRWVIKRGDYANNN